MNRKEYELKSMLWSAPLIIILFGLAAESFLQKALAGNTAMMVFRIIRLPPDISSLVYWFLFVFSAALVMLGFFLIFALLQGKRKVIIGEKSIVVPKFAWSGVKHIEVLFSQISKLEEFKVGRGEFLNLYHTNGKFSLAKSVFKSGDDFEAVRSLLVTKVNT